MSYVVTVKNPFGKELRVKSTLSQNKLNYFYTESLKLLKLQQNEINKMEWEDIEELEQYIFGEEDVIDSFEHTHNLTLENIKDLIDLTEIRERQQDLINNYQF